MKVKKNALIAGIFSLLMAFPGWAAADYKVVKTVEVGCFPKGIAVSEKYVYVANNYDNTVSVLQKSDHSVIKTLTVGDKPVGIGIDANKRYVYVVNQGANGTAGSGEYVNGTVSVIDTTTNSVIKTIPMGLEPTQVAAGPNGEYMYVTNSRSDASLGGAANVAGEIWVISIAEQSVTQKITVGHYPVAVTYAPGKNCLYVANNAPGLFDDSDKSYVSIVNAGAGTVITNNLAVGIYPGGIAAEAGGNYVYVAESGIPWAEPRNNTVAVIRTSDNTVTQRIEVAPGPENIIASGDKVYVVSQDYSKVSIIDVGTQAVIATLSEGINNPWGAAVDAENSTLYVTNSLCATDYFTGEVVQKGQLLLIKDINAQDVVVNFSASVTRGSSPLYVEFTGEIIDEGNKVNWWEWDFGDGNKNTTSFYPAHSYQEPGTYTVSLKVSDTEKFITETKTDYITVQTPPKPWGDINEDNAVDLGDLMLTLQIAAGMSMPADATISLKADLNSDNKIALPEAAFIMQISAGIRERP